MPVSEPSVNTHTLALATSGATPWILATHRHMHAHIKVPASGTADEASGAFSIETSCDAGASKDEVAIAANLLEEAGADPSGAGAVSKTMDFRTSAMYFRIPYARTAGGSDVTATITIVGRE